jgi:SAM-dependent methyltransferase
MIQRYFKNLYRRTMVEAYSFAKEQIVSERSGRDFLECGCGTGRDAKFIEDSRGASQFSYTGIEWSSNLVATARENGLDVIQGDLNQVIPIESESKDCVYALSVLEHLLMPCHFLLECKRVLRTNGRLIILTPNISTYFTAALILAGRMPSSGPHPDSIELLESQELFHVSENRPTSLAGVTPEHRHLVVFSYLVLRKYLTALGFEIEHAKGYGIYPFPNFMQPLLERIDPYHCHQMVMVCRKK